jgi:hypothetical protein
MRSGENGKIQEALEAARLLNILADEADAESADGGCSLVGAVLRDCAYQIKRVAERERESRRRRGEWGSGARSNLVSNALFCDKTGATGAAAGGQYQ